GPATATSATSASAAAMARASPTSSPTWRSRPRKATTSSTKVEAVARLYQLFSDGRVEEAVELLDPDIDWLEPPEQPDRRIVHGREAALAALKAWLATWTDYELEVTDVLEGGDGTVLVCMRQRMRGGATGIAVASDLFH